MRQEKLDIRNLAQTDLSSIVSCLSEAFKNYFVKMPSDVDFWQNRFRAARVDYNLSFGAFDQDKLVAFIIHGIDHHNGLKTAFNTGTGVLIEYRGRQFVDRLYTFAIPILKESGIKKIMLEVIEENHRAIKVYERIGFQKDRFLRCFKGEGLSNVVDVKIEEISINELNTMTAEFQKFYSWDNAMNAITKGGKIFSAFIVKSKTDSQLGYYVINNQNNALLQVESFDPENWLKILEAVSQNIPLIKINNVDNNRMSLIKSFENIGLLNNINQFEMTFLF